MTKQREVLSREQIYKRGLDLEDLPVIDSFDISKENHKKGVTVSLIATLIAIFVFFAPITINGETDVTFGVIYNGIIDLLGDAGLWMIVILTLGVGVASIYGLWIAKDGKLHDYFEGDSKFHPVMYMAGGIFFLLYALTQTTTFRGPEVIVGDATGAAVMPIGVQVFWIITVSSFVMPLLTNYGIIDFIGSLMEPIMRPLFKLPGRAAVNALVSFLSSSSVGVLITNKLYRRKVYTEKEAVLVATGFSAVSVGFAYMMIKLVGLESQFALVYFVALIMTFLVSGFIARIPPFSKKKDVYIDDTVQTEEDLKEARHTEKGLLQTGIDRAAKKAYTAPSLVSEIKGSLKDAIEVIPKVVTSLMFVGTVALILAEYTPIFDYIGKMFVPLLKLLKVPNAAEIAPAFPTGLAEMSLPGLMIAGSVDILAPGARFLVISVSISQVIFFAETVVVMMSAKLPLKIWEIVVVFFERTIIGIIIGAIFMHIIY